jgi:hypothetical protein
MQSLLDANPQPGFLSKLRSKQSVFERLHKSATAWAMRPTRENAKTVATSYQEWSDAQGSRGEREFINFWTTFVTEESEGACWNTSLIPLVLSRNLSIKASSALDLCVLHPRLRSDEFAGPRFVSNLALNPALSQELRIAALVGSLHLGDRRLQQLLVGVWRQMPEHLRLQASQLRAGTHTLGFLEFLLEVLESEQHEDVYGNLAALVARFARLERADGPIVDIERHLPAWDGERGPFRRRSELTREDVRRMIASRLQRLCESETGDRVMPVVLSLWGVDRRAPTQGLLDIQERARRLGEADVGDILPEPPGSKLLIIEHSEFWYRLYGIREEDQMDLVLPALAVLREIRSLPFLWEADLSYCEALAFIAGFQWPYDHDFSSQEFLKPLGMDDGFRDFCSSFVLQVEACLESETELLIEVVAAIFASFKKGQATSEDDNPKQADLLRGVRVGAAFCIGFEVARIFAAASREITVAARLPHQQLVLRAALISCRRCPRLYELPALARHGLASGLVAGDAFDAAIRGQYFIDALSQSIADAKGWQEWGLDAFDCAALAFGAANKRRDAMAAIGDDVARRLHSFYSRLAAAADGTFRGALAHCMREWAVAHPCTGARSFDEIALAVDFGLWAPIVRPDLPR